MHVFDHASAAGQPFEHSVMICSDAAECGPEDAAPGGIQLVDPQALVEEVETVMVTTTETTTVTGQSSVAGPVAAMCLVLLCACHLGLAKHAYRATDLT